MVFLDDKDLSFFLSQVKIEQQAGDKSVVVLKYILVVDLPAQLYDLAQIAAFKLNVVVELITQ